MYIVQTEHILSNQSEQIGNNQWAIIEYDNEFWIVDAESE